jgi:hypothetical protein
VPMSGIKISLAGTFKTASTRENKADFKLTHTNGYTEFTVPILKEYEVVVLGG